MNKFAFIAVAAAMVSTSAFAAPTDSQSLTVTATVAPECSIGDPTDVNFANVIINQDPGANALLINSQSGGGTQNNTQPLWVSCNYGAQTKITSTNGGLVNPEPNDGNDKDDFTNVIEYRVSLTAGSNQAFQTHHLFTKDGGAGVSSTRCNTDAFHDKASLRVYIFNGDNPLRPLSGAYTDTVTLSLGAV